MTGQDDWTDAPDEEIRDHLAEMGRDDRLRLDCPLCYEAIARRLISGEEAQAMLPGRARRRPRG